MIAVKNVKGVLATFIFGFVVSTTCLFSQTNPQKFIVLIEKADSLYTVKEFKSSAFTFSEAFNVRGSIATSNNRYNAACSWALANYPDSAFYNLNYITTLMNYTNSGHLKSDPDLKSLYIDPRWISLLEAVQANKKKIYPNLELITINGFKTEAVLFGLENMEKGKPVIVFENGRGTEFDYWLPIIQEISKENVTFAYNRPRIGNSDDDNKVPTIDHIAENLRKLLIEKGLDPPYLLIGHSWGAAYIRCFASLYPDEIAGLIFVDPHDFVKKAGDGRLPYQEIGLTESQIDSLFSIYDISAEEYIAQGPKFIAEEMKAQIEFSNSGFELCNRNPLPKVPVHFIMAGGYPIIQNEPDGLYDQEKLFRINNNIKMKSWIELIDPMKYGKFFYSSDSGHMVQNDDPELIIASIKLTLKDYDKILNGKIMTR